MKTNGEEIIDDGGDCDAADYVTRKPVTTRKPWSPPSTPSSDISNDLDGDNLPSPSNSGEHEKIKGMIIKDNITLCLFSGNGNTGNVCVKPNEPNPDPSDCSKFYLCANGKPHPMSCREGTLYSARLMTCDHASNVKNCKSKHVPTRVRTVTTASNEIDDNSIDDLYSSPQDSQDTFHHGVSIEEGLSSEKIAIIVLVILLLAVCLLLSWCFRDRIKQLAEPYLGSLGGDKMKPPSALGLLKPNNLAKMPWYTPPDTKTEATNNIPPIPKVQIRNYNLRDLPPLPGGPVPPPRRKKSVVEIQNIESGFSGVDENENTQSIA